MKGIIFYDAEGEGGDTVQDPAAAILLEPIYLIHKIVVRNFSLRCDQMGFARKQRLGFAPE